MAERMLKLVQITMLPELQVRGMLNEAAVAEYRDLLDGEVEMDAVTIFADPKDADSPFWLSDGFHRASAYAQAGRDKIPCVILEGNQSDALEFSLGRNMKHGLAVTNAQKRAAVKRALEDARIRRFADKKIAKMCGVSASLVGQIRSGKAEKEKKPRAAKAIVTETAATETKVHVPEPVSNGGAGPAATPVVAHERKPENAAPTKVETFDDRMRTLALWVKQDYIDLPAIAAAAETKALRLLVVPKKKMELVFAEEGVTLRSVKLKKIEMVDGRIQVEMESGEEMPA